MLFFYEERGLQSRRVCCSGDIFERYMTCQYKSNGSFTLPNTDTETGADTDKICIEPNENLHRSLSLTSMNTSTVLYKPFLPPANEVWGKVISLQACICLRGGST